MQIFSFSDRKLRRLWWLSPRPFDLVSTLLYLVVLITYFYDPCRQAFQTITYVYSLPATRASCSSSLGWDAILLVCCIATLLLVDRWEYWRYGDGTPRKMALILLGSRILLIAAGVWLDRLHFAAFLFLFLPFLACLYFGNKAGYAMASLTWVAYLAFHTLLQPDWYLYTLPFNNLLIFTIGLIFTMIMSIIVLDERASRKCTEQLLVELEDSHQQLQGYAAQVEELTTTKERNRLARDIHDTLGHYLTIINVQLEKAQAFRAQQPEEADQAVEDAKRMAREALQDVRRSVGILRSTSVVFSFETSMQALAEHTGGTGFAVDLQIEGCHSDYSTSSLIALYRAVQEGLTNVQRHARAHLAQVRVNFGEREATLTVSDDGCGFEPASLLEGRKSFGLLGMQERLELVGGHVEIKSRPSEGTRLLISVPKETQPL